jgi:hypothetical protein
MKIVSESMNIAGEREREKGKTASDRDEPS